VCHRPPVLRPKLRRPPLGGQRCSGRRSAQDRAAPCRSRPGSPGAQAGRARTRADDGPLPAPARDAARHRACPVPRRVP
jgi:hypothetical protein